MLILLGFEIKSRSPYQNSLFPRLKFHFNFKFLAQEYVHGKENIFIFWRNYMYDLVKIICTLSIPPLHVF